MNTNRNNKSINVRRRARRGRRNRPVQTNTVKSRVGMNVAAPNPKQNFIQPEFRMQKFKWQADYGRLTNNGNSYAGKMMYANNLYDPDPALVTSGVAGYAENMKFYYYCLPIDVKCKVTVCNYEGFPVKVCLLSTVNQTDTYFSSTQNIIDLGENAQSTNWTELSAGGGQDRATLVLRTNFGRANGNEFEYNGNAQNYSCQPTAGPPYPMFMSLLIWANSNFTASGVSVSWQYTWNTRLWARNIVLDSGPTLDKKLLQVELEQKRKEYTSLKEKIAVIQTLAELDERHAAIYGQLQESLLQAASTISDIELAIDNPYRLIKR